MEGFMKKFMVLTALLVSGAVLAQNIHQASDDTSRGQSLVKDGTFQVDRKQNFFGSWLANFKLLEQNPGLVALDETVSVKDGQSIRLSNPKGPNVGLMQTVHGIKPATKYRLSYYLKYTDINPDKVEGFGGVVLINGFPPGLLPGRATGNVMSSLIQPMPKPLRNFLSPS